jgi:hypothetical protein
MMVESSGRCKKFCGQDCISMYVCVKGRGSFGSKICVSLFLELIENFMVVVSIFG